MATTGVCQGLLLLEFFSGVGAPPSGEEDGYIREEAGDARKVCCGVISGLARGSDLPVRLESGVILTRSVLDVELRPEGLCGELSKDSAENGEALTSGFMWDSRLKERSSMGLVWADGGI